MATAADTTTPAEVVTARVSRMIRPVADTPTPVETLSARISLSPAVKDANLGPQEVAGNAPAVTFAVAPASRQGTFTSGVITYPGGYSTIFYQLNIPNPAEYENAANSFTASLLVDGVNSDSTWIGGRQVDKFGTVDPPPAFAYDISGVTPGAILQISVAVPNAMTVGIQHGLIS